MSKNKKKGSSGRINLLDLLKNQLVNPCAQYQQMGKIKVGDGVVGEEEQEWRR